jgi:excalibur calcium-binding domain-containing protein
MSRSAGALIVRVCLLAMVSALLLAPAANAAKHFPNCKAVDAVHPHGIARNVHAATHATGLTGRPFVSLKLYVANHGLDRDKDGVACEK